MFLNNEPVAYAHLVKLVHVFAGVYVWEYVTNLDFEWEIYTGQRHWRWSFLVYLVARALALACLVTMMVGFDVTTPYDCDVWFRVVLATSWSSGVFASLLLVLRGVALWARDRKVIAIASTVWFANLGGSIYATTRGYSHWSSSTGYCPIDGTSDFRWSILINFIQDLTLLCIMFSGVLHKKNSTRLWNMLYIQGLWWILAWILTELPSIALSFRGVNEHWNLMFQVPHMTLTVITASRAYRILFQYITNDHESYPPPRRRIPATNAPRILYDGQDLRVAIHRTVEYDVTLPLPPLPKHPLPTHRLGTAIVLKDMGRASSSGSSTVASSSRSEFSSSGAASPVFEGRHVDER
ncbi:hypothetical protein EDB87DRAFT_1821666 [Lactarius vividus]|nr:hypothetical protein EDB87DRAFT_1821666 [Lactarius vividus]